jgi:hypothetical protein
MTFLLIIPAWILLMSLVAGLCMAARTGDDELLDEIALAERSAWRGSGSTPAVAIVARPGTRAPASRAGTPAGERTGVGVAA